MLFLLALPAFLAAAVAHRYLTLYAPSNILIRHVRMSPPRWWAVAALVVLTAVLLLAMRAVDRAINVGAPGWFSLIALVLAWDVIKLAALATTISFRCLMRGRKRSSTPETMRDSGITTR